MDLGTIFINIELYIMEVHKFIKDNGSVIKYVVKEGFKTFI